MLNRLRSLESRNARRRSRVARWDRPIAGALDRLRAWANMLLFDHGVFRLLYLNAHPVGSGRVWRTAQPAPHHIRSFRARGVRTIVSLRGQREYGSWQLQRDACLRHGIDLVDVAVRSRSAPSRETLLELRDVFDRIRYPAVIHCKSGADRAGLAAALYLIFREGSSVEVAAGQLSIRYGHLRFSKTGVLDAFFQSYLAFNERHPIGFAEWIERHYAPDATERAASSRFLHTMIGDRLLRRE